MKACQVVNLAKIALTLVQNWICKNEVIDLKNTKISKNHCAKSNGIESIASLYELIVCGYRRLSITSTEYHPYFRNTQDYLQLYTIKHHRPILIRKESAI